MSYKTIYFTMQDGTLAPFCLFLIFATLMVALFSSPKVVRALIKHGIDNGAPAISPVALQALIRCFGAIPILAAFWAILNQFELVYAYGQRQCEEIEGIITNVGRDPHDRPVTFSVADHDFHYDAINPSHDIVFRDGQRVKVWFKGNYIARIDAAIEESTVP